MSSALNIRISMVAAVMGVIVMLMGAEGAPLNGTDLPSHRLILDQQAMFPPRRNRPINNRSLSPWTDNVTHDENRYPMDITEAKCSLAGCLTLEGKETMDAVSRPILHEILVLRRVPGEGKDYFWRLESKTISVGCTCVRHHVERN